MSTEAQQTPQAPIPAPAPAGISVTEAASRLAAAWGAEPPSEERIVPRRERSANAQPDEPAPEPPRQRAQPEPESIPDPDEDLEDEPLLAADDAETETDPDDETEQGPPDRLTLDEMASDYGLDKNQLMQVVRHNVKVGDEDREVGLHELVMGYQRGKEHEAGMAALDSRQKAFEAEATAKAQELQGAATQLQATAGVIDKVFEQEEQSIHARYQGVDWADLRAKDAGEYSALWAEYQQGLNNTQARKQSAWGQLNDAHQKLGEAHQKAQQERLEESRKNLGKWIPAWKDQSVWQREGAELGTYMRDEFEATPQEIASITDPRVLRWAHDSMTLARMRKKADEARSQSKQAPTQAAAGRKITPKAVRGRTRRKRFEDARQRLRKTGRQADAVEALKSSWETRR